MIAPRADGGHLASSGDRANDGFAGLLDDDAVAGEGALILLLLAAFGWGALHALSPGHGKAMVAAYLVGARGTARHAVMLGATVTVTHTIGVFALGIVTLALSQYLLPEDLYPWLNLAAGLLVLLVGAMVLRARVRAKAGHHVHDLGDERGDHLHHVHDLGDEHGHQHPHTHGHGHHHHHAPESLRPRALLTAGVAAGLIPCPSALVVLLGAISQHEIALGLLLIVVFSLGLGRNAHRTRDRRRLCAPSRHAPATLRTRRTGPRSSAGDLRDPHRRAGLPADCPRRTRDHLTPARDARQRQQRLCDAILGATFRAGELGRRGWAVAHEASPYPCARHGRVPLRPR